MGRARSAMAIGAGQIDLPKHLEARELTQQAGQSRVVAEVRELLGSRLGTARAASKR